MKAQSCSVAMATYNGEKYILEQLDSLKNQTQIIDEIIICDDCSTDDTVSLIESYMIKNPNINIKLYKNEKNLGYSKNFYKAASLTMGDIIFFSDQDDIWSENKVKNVCKCFSGNEVGAVLCNFTLINGNSHFINKKEKGYKSFNGFFGRFDFAELIKNFSCGGLNLAVRREYICNYSQFIIDHGLSHDVPLGIILSSQKKLFYLDEVLVYHRVHSNNVTKPSYNIIDRIKDYRRQVKSAFHKYQWLKECESIVIDYLNAEEKRSYVQAREFYKESYYALESQSLSKIISLSFTNCQYINKKFAIYNIVAVIMMKVFNNGK